MDITERLQLFMQHEGVTTYQMNKNAGLSRALLSKAIEKHQGLNSTTIKRISDTYPNLNIDWLVTGRGVMLINEELPKLSKQNIHKLPKDLENSIYRQIVWHLLLQDSYKETHERLIEIIDTLNSINEQTSTLAEQLSRIRVLLETQYAIQSQDHGLYEMTLRIAAGEDGKYSPDFLKDDSEIIQRMMRYISNKKQQR